MSQSSVIAFSLLIGFIVYITIKGELPAYAATVGFGASSSPASNAVSTAIQNTESDPTLSMF